MQNNFSINLMKMKVEKGIVNELYKKNIIEFNQYNTIIKKLDEEIYKIESKIKKDNNTINTNLIVNVLI